MKNSNQILSFLTLVGLSAALLGFSVLSCLHAHWTQYLFIHASYYLISLLTGIWIYSVATYLKKQDWDLGTWLKAHKFPLLFSFILGLVVFFSVPIYHRILSDETNLLAVAKSMTYERTVENITMGKWYYFNFYPSNHETPIRPLLFPFFVHGVHTLTGIRPENALILNFMTLVAILYLVIFLVKKQGGTSSAYLAALFAACQPVLADTATSSGFDLFSAFFTVLAACSLQIFLSLPSGASFGLLWWTLAMLLNIRYESGLFFVLTIGLLFLFRKIKMDYLKPLWLYLMTFALFLPRLWQQIIIFRTTNQFETDPGVPPFSLNHFKEHGLIFLKSFINFEFYLPYATVINLIGAAGLFYFLFKKINSNERKITLFEGLVSLNLWLFAVTIIGYHMGDLSHAASSRYFVLLFIFFSSIAALFLTDLRIFRERPDILAVFGILMFLLYHPLSIQNRFMNALFLPREYRVVLGYLKDLKHRNLLLITDRPGQFTAYDYGAVNFQFANSHSKDLLNELSRHLFRDLYVVQEILYDTQAPNAYTDLNKDYPLVPVLELQNKAESYIRISKVDHAKLATLS